MCFKAFILKTTGSCYFFPIFTGSSNYRARYFYSIGIRWHHVTIL